jgi:hypothetical protein
MPIASPSVAATTYPTVCRKLYIGADLNSANAVFTRYTREFARTWDGTGVDTDLVDPVALRENWLSPTPHAPSMTLLQQAWLSRPDTLTAGGHRRQLTAGERKASWPRANARAAAARGPSAARAAAA